MNNNAINALLSCKRQKTFRLALMQAPILIHWIRLEEIYCFTVKTQE